MWGKRILTEFLLVEEIFGLLSVPFDAVTWHTTLDAALTWSRCRTITQSWVEYPQKNLHNELERETNRHRTSDGPSGSVCKPCWPFSSSSLVW